MKTRYIITLLICLPFLTCLSEFFIRNDKFSVKARDFRKFFNERSIIMQTMKSMAYSYYSVVTPYKISSICPGEGKFIFYCPVSDGNVIRDVLYDLELPIKDEPDDDALDRLLGHKELYYLDIPSRFRIYVEEWPLADGIEPQYVMADNADEMYSKLLGNHYYSVRENEQILDKHKDEYIYYFRDTHWTPLGAYYIIKNMNLPFFKDLRFKKDLVFDGDVVRMANTLSGTSFKGVDHFMVLNNSDVKIESDATGHERKFINNKSAGPKILVVGDSFRESFSSALAGAASQIDEYHSSKFETMKIDLKKYDYVFILRTERYITGAIAGY